MIDNFQIEEMVEQTQRYVSYKCYNLQSGRKCLLKRYLVDETSGLGRVEGWQEEFLAVVEEFNKVEVPSLRTLIGGGLDPQDGNPFAVFEWFEVSSLSEVIKDNQAIDLTLTKDMTRAALDAIGFLHKRGWVHGDLSPQSVFYTDSTEKNPWVLNWDPIRSLRCKHGVNRFGMNIYMAPELTSGSPSTVQTDLYAIGKTCEKVSGSHAKEPNFSNWLNQMTSFEPESRFESAEVAFSSLPVEEAPVPQATRPEPLPTRLIVPAKPPATPTAPIVTAQASHPNASVGQAQKITQKVPLKSAKPKGGVGIAVTIGLFTLLIGVCAFLLTRKKEDKPKVIANSPISGDNLMVDSSSESSKEKLKSDEPEMRSTSEATANNTVSRDYQEGDVISATDFDILDARVDKKVSISGEIIKVLIVENVLELYLTDDKSPDAICKITVEERRRTPFPPVDELSEMFVGETVKLEGDVFRKFNNKQKIYSVEPRKITDIVNTDSEKPLFTITAVKKERALLPGMTSEDAAASREDLAK